MRRLGAFLRHLKIASLITVAFVLSALIQVAVIGAAGPFLIFVEVQGNITAGGLDGAVSVTVSSDGKHVYAVGYIGDAVTVFSRDATTGALTFVEAHKNGVGDVDGLDGATSVTVSPDGENLYVASYANDAVATFSRNSTTGALIFVEFHKDGVAGVDGLNGAISVTVSPDAKHVYAASQSDDAVAVFSRSSTTGALTFVEVQKENVGGVDGLLLAQSVKVSPDGQGVYTSGAYEGAVSVFSRNSTTGTLIFVEVQKDGVGGVDGMIFPASVAVSPDGKHLYVAGLTDDAVVAFSVNTEAIAPGVPSISQWGLIGLTVLMAAAGAWRFRWRAAQIRRRGLG